MRILLTGAGGQVGWELQRQLQASTLVACTRADLDISSAAAVAEKVAALSPDIIVNAAAYTQVDLAESELQAAQTVNTLAPGYLAEAAAACGAAIIHLSTDFVFSGDGARPLLPHDPLAPCGVYAQTKADGEAAVRAASPKHIILRTAWVYSTHGKNFVKTMIRLARERPELRVVADQRGTPTYAADIATAIRAVIKRLDQQPWGTYHFTNSGEASWYDFAVAIIEQASARLPLAVERIVPIATADYPTPAVRPSYSVLDTTSFSNQFACTPRPWEQALAAAFSCQDEPFC